MADNHGKGNGRRLSNPPFFVIASTSLSPLVNYPTNSVPAVASSPTTSSSTRATIIPASLLSPPEPTSLSQVAIIGIVVGCLAAVILFLTVMVLWLRRRRRPLPQTHPPVTWGGDGTELITRVTPYRSPSPTHQPMHSHERNIYSASTASTQSIRHPPSYRFHEEANFNTSPVSTQSSRSSRIGREGPISSVSPLPTYAESQENLRLSKAKGAERRPERNAAGESSTQQLPTIVAPPPAPLHLPQLTFIPDELDAEAEAEAHAAMMGSFVPVDHLGLGSGLGRGVGNLGTVRSVSTVSSMGSSLGCHGIAYWERHIPGDADAEPDGSHLRSGRASSILVPGLLCDSRGM
jgi:hypothetical protein